MGKVNISKIVADMQKLYAKDKKVNSLISTGDVIRTTYTENDGIPLTLGHPIQQLLGLSVLPYNKIIQCVGKPDCGKSTWAAELMVQAQQAEATVILFDSEDKFDAKRFTTMGGVPKDLLLIKTNEILKGGELIRKYITAIKQQSDSAKILVVWDSVGGSQSRSHAERELDSEKHAQPGQDAKENGSVMKAIVALINKYPDSVAVYLVNQSYAKIGFMQKGEAAAGGSKIEYHSSFIVALKRIKTLTKVVKGIVSKYGIVSRATVSKNHLSQGETSIHQLDFEVTAQGTKVIEGDNGEIEE